MIVHPVIETWQKENKTLTKHNNTNARNVKS